MTGDLLRTLDLKKVTNYNMMNVDADVPYSMAVSAYDTTGNESDSSIIITAIVSTSSLTADGDMDGDGLVTIVDAVKLLRIALGLNPAEPNSMILGDMDKDGKLTIQDAVIVIRKVVRQE